MDDHPAGTPLARRAFLGAAAAAGAAALTGLPSGRARADAGPAAVTSQPGPLGVAAESPWQVNQVVVIDRGQLFAGGPRHISPAQVTPSLARRQADGTFVPFPGNSWNDWEPGDSGVDQFVNIITVRLFWDQTLWVCDWGAPMSDPSATPAPGAQKVVNLDPVSGTILEVLRFDDEILPPGSAVNGLRIHGNHLYIADSGLGGIIVHDLATGKTLRRLSGYPQVTASAGQLAANPPPAGRTVPDHSDLLQCTADGAWLYWAPPQGPIRRCRTDLIRDPAIPDEELARRVEFVANVASPGAGLDTLGNLYLSDAHNHRFDLLPSAPRDAAARTVELPLSTSDAGLSAPDSVFVSADRRLYTCASQFGLAASATAPWLVYTMPLPKTFGGYRLGDQVTGRPAPAGRPGVAQPQPAQAENERGTR